jgi:hypothetical protein
VCVCVCVCVCISTSIFEGFVFISSHFTVQSILNYTNLQLRLISYDVGLHYTNLMGFVCISFFIISNEDVSSSFL